MKYRGETEAAALSAEIAAYTERTFVLEADSRASERYQERKTNPREIRTARTDTVTMSSARVNAENFFLLDFVTMSNIREETRSETFLTAIAE